MCSLLAYLGRPVLLDELLYAAKPGLVGPVDDAQVPSSLSLDGFDLVAWAADGRQPTRPFSYRTPPLASLNGNRRGLAQGRKATAVLAHVQGLVNDPRKPACAHNVHPLLFETASVALAQDGHLHDFARMRLDLAEHLRPELAALIEGTTDAEWMYALVLSMLDDPFAPVAAPEAVQAVERALAVVEEVRPARAMTSQSQVNLVLSDGRWLLASRIGFRSGYRDHNSSVAGWREHRFTSLWLRAPDAGDSTSSVMIASDSPGRDRDGWFELPEDSMIILERGDSFEVSLDARELPR